MKRSSIFLLALGIISLFGNVQHAQAHVIIRDEANSVGAILHITPDDDPIAGEPSSIYFNLKGQSLTNSKVAATITDTSTEQVENLDVSMSSSGVEAQYTFPSRGVYEINLSITGERDYSFTHAQRVSRGIGTDSTPPASYPLATLALALSAIALLLTGLFYANRKKGIDKQSKF